MKDGGVNYDNDELVAMIEEQDALGIIESLNDNIANGAWIHVYKNMDLGSADLGRCLFIAQKPDADYPDTLAGMQYPSGWAYCHIGTYAYNIPLVYVKHEWATPTTVAQKILDAFRTLDGPNHSGYSLTAMNDICMLVLIEPHGYDGHLAIQADMRSNGDVDLLGPFMWAVSGEQGERVAQNLGRCIVDAYNSLHVRKE